MAYLEILHKHNADLGGLIEKANSLPEKGDLGKQFDALIDGTLTEVTSGAMSVKSHAFDTDSTITSVNFPNATSIGDDAFNGCTSLMSANFPSATNVSNSAFYECKKLADVNLPNATVIGPHAFFYCDLMSVNFPSATSVAASAFAFCTKLATVDLASVASINQSVFNYCYSLKALVLRSETIRTLINRNAFNNCCHILGIVDSTYNPNGDKDGYFYVPRALVEDYKAATNWANFSTQFRALEDYTVDGTITGALDPNKI